MIFTIFSIVQFVLSKLITGFKVLSTIQFEFDILHGVVIIICEAVWFKVLKMNNLFIGELIALGV